MTIRSLALATAFVGLSSTAHADHHLKEKPAPKVSGQIRITDEVKRGVYSPGDPDGDVNLEFAHMRTRVRVDAVVSDVVSAVVELQDVRTLGSEGSTVADTEGVDLKRGYMMVSNIGDAPLSLKLGRFVLAYGDQRLIGHLEWFDQGRTYDGALLSYAPDGYFVDAFGTRIRETTPATDDQALFGLYAGAKDWLPEGVVEVYAIGFADYLEAMGEQAMDSTMFGTFGARATLKASGVDATAEAALQAGSLRGDDLLAYACALNAGYTVGGSKLAPRFGLGLAYASGDDDPTDGDSKQFQTLTPTNHFLYGYADVAAWTNIVDAELQAQFVPVEKKLWVKLFAHHFRLADPAGGWVNAGGGLIRPGDADASSHLGDEIDVMLTWKPTAGLVLWAGYAHFFAGGFVSDTGGGDDADFGYVQGAVSF